MEVLCRGEWPCTYVGLVLQKEVGKRENVKTREAVDRMTRGMDMTWPVGSL